MQESWDQRFAGPGFKYGTAPNAFMVGQVMRLPRRGRVLVPGDGEGRNGVWLAGRGFEVTSLDYSAVGLAKAQTLAGERGVPLTLVHADLTAWSPPTGTLYDGVVLVFVHLPSAARRRVHRKLASVLAPGGCLMLEAFHPAQLAFDSGGPKDPDMLATLEDIREDFAPLMREAMGWQGESILDEGPGHQGRAHLTRYVGRRFE